MSEFKIWLIIISMAPHYFYCPVYVLCTVLQSTVYTIYCTTAQHITAYSSPREHNIWGPLMLEECHLSPSPPQWSQEILKLYFHYMHSLFSKQVGSLLTDCYDFFSFQKQRLFPTKSLYRSYAENVLGQLWATFASSFFMFSGANVF